MYSHVFVGGTFDSLHKGHTHLLSKACEIGDRVTVGLTSDEFVAQYRAGQSITPYAVRKQQLLTWITSHNQEDHVEVIAIDDPFEPAASMADVDAILVTADNKVRGEEINSRRIGRQLPACALVEVSMVGGEDQKPISSTKVRNGEIDRDGRLVMPDSLRPELTKPLGTVLVGDAIGSSLEHNRMRRVVAVGDVTTSMLLTAGIVPSLAIVDFLVQRQPFRELVPKLEGLSVPREEVVSGPGFISKDAIARIGVWAASPDTKLVLVVSGEEDLLTLPAVAYAPVGTVVYYGQPDKGLVEVVVTDDKKQEAQQLLTKFV